MESERQPETARFKCNVCGERCLVAVDNLRRDIVSCKACGSTPRTRSIIRVLSMELFAQNLVLGDFPESRSICGLGMTDWDGYAISLAEKFRYTNTYYHQEPKLDISNPEIPEGLVRSNDFIISSDVFEHVAPPVLRAFQNTFEMLKPGGVFILSAPYGIQAETIEHFPDLYNFTIIKSDNSYHLKNVTRSGEVQEFHDLIFHGGPGATLEMRVFAEAALLQHLAKAGFENIMVHRTPDLAHGIWWPQPWGFPLSARRPR